MEDQPPRKSRNSPLFWGLFIYTGCMILFPPSKSGIDLIRIPSFTLLLLILMQVIFPQFRYSKTANLIATIVIIGVPLIQTLTRSL